VIFVLGHFIVTHPVQRTQTSLFIQTLIFSQYKNNSPIL